MANVPSYCIEARGLIIGGVVLVDCRPLKQDDWKEALCEVSPTRFAWVLENPHIFETFTPAKGRLGLYEVEEAIFNFL